MMSDKYFNLATSKIIKTAFSNKYWFALVLTITVLSVNHSYSITMMFLTTFILAYLTKDSRRQ